MSIAIKNRRPEEPEMAEVPVFPLWVRHHPEEPAYSLLSRTVERNVPGDFMRVSSLLGSYGGQHASAVSPGHCARICEADPAAVLHATPAGRTQKSVHLLGHVLRSDDVTTTRRRWCPACLDEHGAHLAWWDIRFVGTCPRHRNFLCQQCACGADVYWKSAAGFSFCKCGLRLADQAAPAASDVDCAPDAYVVGRLTGRAEGDNALLDRLPLVEAIDAIRRVGHLVLDRHSSVRPIEKSHGYWKIMREGFLALSDFPRSFRTALDRIVGASEVPDGKFGSHRVYGAPFMSWLLHEEPRNLHGALSKEVREHAHRHLTLCRGRPLLGQTVSQSFITITDAAAASGVSTGRMKNALIQHGLIPHRTRLGLPTRLEAGPVLALSARLRDAVTLEAAEAELGVASRVLREIIAAGHIQYLVEGGRSVRPALDRDAAKTLLDRLRSKLRRKDVRGAMCIPLAAKSLCMPIAEVITEVLEDRLQVTALVEGLGLASILVDANGRRASYRRARSSTMTARDVARTFGVKEEIAIALLKTGRLAATREGHHWLADAASAEAFFREHVLTIELAPKLGTSAKYLNGFLEANGIVPVLGPPLVERKFFHRATAEAFLAEASLPKRKLNKKRTYDEA
jgi:hypothetical protein